MKKFICILICLVLIISLSVTVFASGGLGEDNSGSTGGIVDYIVPIGTTGGGSRLTSHELALLTAIVYIQQPNFPSFSQLYSEVESLYQELPLNVRVYLDRTGKGIFTKPASLPDDIRNSLNSYLQTLENFPCSIPSDVTYLGDGNNYDGGGSVVSFENLNLLRPYDLFMTTSDYANVIAYKEQEKKDNTLLGKIQSLLNVFTEDLNTSDSAFGVIFRQVTSIRSAIRDQVTPSIDNGTSDLLDDNKQKEDSLIHVTKPGLNKSLDYLRTTLDLLRDYSTAFVALTSIFTIFYEIPMLKILCFVSLAVGVISSILNLSVTITNSFNGKSDSSSKFKKRGG